MAQTMLRDYLQETEDAISAKRFDVAFERCQRVLNQFPELLEAQRLLGKVYMAQGNLEDAQQMFDWVLTNDPENAVVYCDRALLSEHMSDVDTALDCYQQAYELSCGNGQIRLDFNRLSVRAGQQGFMFSRAGLARLYMRGDLLSQALQEWEIVLASSPERLDARLGLLETCWRDGHLERAEQIARQIVQDIPGCLKALLLLALVISPTDMRESQELIQRAATLDPELLMAQDLFADMMASQPGNPFFKLLRKEPAVVAGTRAEAPSTDSVASKDAIASSNTIPQWNDLDGWNNNEQAAENTVASNPQSNGTTINDISWNALDKPQEQLAENPSSPRLGGQSAYEANEATHTDDTANDNIWSVLEQNMQTGNEQDYSFDVWSPMQEAMHSPNAEHTINTIDQAQQHETSNNHFAEVPLEEPNPWSSLTNAFAPPASNSSNAWDMSEVQGAPNEQPLQAPIPPFWLNMLTQGEPEQTNEPQLTPSLHTNESQNAFEPPVVPQNEEAAISFQSAWNAKSQDISDPGKQDEEPSFFGPEWLKSLGAASFSGLSADDTTATSPLFTEQEPQRVQAQQAQEAGPTYQSSVPKAQDQELTYEPWQSHVQEELAYEPWVPKAQGQEQTTYEFWEQSAQEQQGHDAQELGQQEEDEFWQAQLQEPVATTDQTILATLENLESGLRSQGFVPLEPNSLSTIAQTTPVTEEVAETPLQQEVPQEKQLSSAFTHLGALDYGHAPAPKSSDTPVQRPSVELPEEPLWAASLRTVPSSLPAVNVPQETPIAPAKRETVPLLQPAASMQPAPKQEQTIPTQGAPSQPMRVDVLPGPVFKPEVIPVTPTPAYAPQRESAKVPVARANTTFDSDFELETTMKRPAVHLQAMHAQRFAERLVDHSFAPPPSQPASLDNGRKGEQLSVGKVTDDAVSYKDRLVKGYQHQLTGDYDEAMQEYRVIIRNVPELLSEVVSNVRALLKLAPKYAAGYRVLGDAYMRQGEYLQAMEAYNKALNMAKKARS